jgi:peptide/nickel transport system permease protein
MAAATGRSGTAALRRPPRLARFGRYLRRNPSLVAGLLVLLFLALLWSVAYAMVDTAQARPLSVRPNLAPSLAHPLGSDRQGRELLAVMVVGTPLTLRIGLIAGAVGLVIGTVLAFLAAFYGGWLDQTVRLAVDTLQTIPGLLVLVLIAIALPRRTGMSVDQMALVIAALSWLTPTRLIRAQVLVMKERLYVEVARASGMSGPEIILRELMPNFMPYLVANFVIAVSAAILASIGLEALGLGPMEANTLGMTIYWNIYYASILHGLWWWYGPPIAIIVTLFIGLFLVTAGLDEWANPRLRHQP